LFNATGLVIGVMQQALVFTQVKTLVHWAMEVQ
jgi:hypothetical protein